MWIAQQQDYETECSEVEIEILDLAAQEARRRDLIALHVAGRIHHPTRWNERRGEYILAATQGRTRSSRECSSAELREALRLLETRYAPEPLVSPNGFGSGAVARAEDEGAPAWMYMDDAAAGISSW